MNLTLSPGGNFRADPLDRQKRRQDDATLPKFLNDTFSKEET